MKIKYSIQAGIVAVAATITAASCTDTWDDHYSVVSTVPGATLWENMLQDESLRPFVRVLDTCGYDRILMSDQGYTVWAPEITDADADQLIARYRQAQADAAAAHQTLLEEDNPTVREFIRNHIALYAQSLSELTDDTITMMNGKRMTLTQNSLNGTAQILSGSAVPSSNGVLYKLDRPAKFFSNIWETLQKHAIGGDEGLDSLVQYFTRWQREVLDEEASVPGGVEDGQTVYLDSVMYRYNQLFNLKDGLLDAEDSLYWYLAPTNKVWREQVAHNEAYFNFHTSRGSEIDSLRSYYARSMFLDNTFFNIGSQPGQNFNIGNPDSICSTAYNSFWPGYYMFERPLQNGGILAGIMTEECSNGRLYTATEWNIPNSKTLFMQEQVVEAEIASNYVQRTNLGEGNNTTDIQVARRSQQGRKYTLSGSQYLVVRDTRAVGNQPEITFLLPDLLSNCPYDIKVVFATPLASDSTATADAALKRRITAYLRYYEEADDDEVISANNAQRHPICRDVDVDATRMDTVTVAENQVFPVCSYGDAEASVYLTIRSLRRSSTMPEGYAQDLYIDCILIEPKPEAAIEGDN